MAFIWNTVFGNTGPTTQVDGPKAGAVTFTINDEPYTIDPAAFKQSADYRLLDFIRNDAALTGTKYMCREGGCGACVVSVTTKDPVSGKDITRAVNACLVPALSCHGWAIKTIESLGNKKTGYHEIQQRLVRFSGSQCGWCSSGMVMNMYSLTKSKSNLKQQEIEDSFDGNICRCTGYRPIMDAFKSLAIDAPKELKDQCTDIEDICVTCPVKWQFVSKEDCKAQCTHRHHLPSISEASLKLPSNEEWVKATSLANAFENLTKFVSDGKKYRIVAGNTGQGVFKNDGPYSAYLDINDIAELKVTKIESASLTVGLGNTLSSFIEFLDNASKQAGFEYTALVAKHIRRVANVPVRNLGTIGGNLMLKYAHSHFPSDIFLLMETIGASINVACNVTTTENYKIQDFLKVDMTGKILTSIVLPQRSGYTFRSFKITKRHQNAHAYVNAGFLFKIDKGDSHKENKVVERPNIVFGGISPTFVHASKTEDFLNGKELGQLQTIRDAVILLKDEISPDHILPDASLAYRKNLTQTLFYKTILGILQDRVTSRNKSGGEDLPRNLTRGEQKFDQDTGNSPLYKPVAKLEAPAQVSGEAEYVNDIPVVAGELHGAFVISAQANCTLGTVDATAALAMPGVVAYITHKDIPGENNCMGFAGPDDPEPIFIVDRIEHAGQAIGLIVAKDDITAHNAALAVKIQYTNIQQPIVTIDAAVQKAKDEGTYDKIFGTPFKSPEGPQPAAHEVTGTFMINSQAHVQMETHTTLCRPNERGLDVYSATQWMDLVQGTIASALNVPNNTVSVRVRRLGGGYGSKISKATHVAVACAVAAHALNKPVRIVLDFETNMQMIGKRFPIQAEYKVGFDDNGKIHALRCQAICDTGSYANETTDVATLLMVQSCYQAKGWELVPGRVKTNTHANTWCRAPGSVKGVAIGELIMEHIAHTLKKDPIEIRKNNWIQPGDPIVIPNPYDKFEGQNLAPELVDEIQQTSDYVARKAAVEKFNLDNRWRKRGIALCPMRYSQGYGVKFGALVTIYHEDGSVAVGHAGIEMGQGINTKIAQVVAHVLGVALDKIEIKPSDNLVGANSDTTGGALTSELVSYAAMTAAQTLRDRIEAIKTEQHLEDKPWEEIIKACFNSNVDLTATHFHTPKDPPKAYNIFGVNVVEAEIDCLTGEFKIVRSDILQDAGKSLSPEVDIGQVEGAYIMGLGLWTKERLVYDEATGQLLTKNTWEYKVPFPKCIPEDLRVHLVSNRPNPLGVLSSKSTGEAPICLSITNFLAIRNAIAAARKEAGNEDWFNLESPVTPERVVEWCLTDASQFSY